MQYLLLIHDRPDLWAGMAPADVEATMAEYGTFTNGLVERGVMRGGAPLDGASTLVRVRDGATQTHDAPYGAGPEATNGWYLVEAATRDEAIAIAAGIPSARLGTIEVRAVAAM